MMLCYILWIQKCIFDACRQRLHNSGLICNQATALKQLVRATWQDDRTLCEKKASAWSVSLQTDDNYAFINRAGITQTTLYAVVSRRRV